MAREPVVYWDRREGARVVERVYGDRVLRWLYQTRAGRRLAGTLLCRPWLSRITGAWQSSRWSRRRVPAFIRRFDIPMEEYEEREFRSFNDFFARRFRSGARSFCSAPRDLPAFAEGKCLAWRTREASDRLPVKGFEIAPELLLGGAERAAPFRGGSALVIRLCPTDYHRFHYPDRGRTIDGWHLRGRLHSVSPIALAARREILVRNDRRVSVLQSESFGKLAYIEVGALNVGRIVQTHPIDQPFCRGGEKGYFLFGGSTVILLGEPDRWTPDGDLLERTAEGVESFVRLGERVARAGEP